MIYSLRKFVRPPAMLGLAAGLLAMAGGAVASAEPYKAEQQVKGVIRSQGFSLGGVYLQWQEAFKKLQPDIIFQNNLPTSDLAFPALVTNVADIGPNGGEPAIVEALSFFETHGYHSSHVIVATGSYDREGRSNGPVVFVHKDNPLTQLTIEQLDGIFGSERSGGLNGYEWTLKGARAASQDIRLWKDIGVKGACANKPIRTFGHGPSGATRFFQLHVLGGSDKWNPNYRGYVETGSKQLPPDERGEGLLGAKHMLANEIARDPCSIGWSIMSQAKDIEGIKPVALAARGTRNFVMPSEQSFRDRSYPLARNIYLYFDRPPGAPVQPRLKEFLSFALSDEGQKMVSDAGYLALPPAMLAAQRAKLN